MEEFSALLDPGVEDLIKRSLFNVTVGEGYRNGGINGDNCEFIGASYCGSSLAVTLYSVSSIQQPLVSSSFYLSPRSPKDLLRFMRIMLTTYTGNLLGNANMSHWGNVWAEQGIAAFDIYNTLPEASHEELDYIYQFYIIYSAVQFWNV